MEKVLSLSSLIIISHNLNSWYFIHLVLLLLPVNWTLIHTSAINTQHSYLPQTTGSLPRSTTRCLQLEGCRGNTDWAVWSQLTADSDEPEPGERSPEVRLLPRRPHEERDVIVGSFLLPRLKRRSFQDVSVHHCDRADEAPPSGQISHLVGRPGRILLPRDRLGETVGLKRLLI